MSKTKSRLLTQNIYGNEKEPTKSKNRLLRMDTGTKSISGGAYLGGKAVTGALSIVEGTTDMLTGVYALLTGDKDLADYTFRYDNWVQDMNDKLDAAYDPNKVMRFVGDTASGLGQSATFLIPYAGQVLFFTGVMGNSISSASQQTGKVGAREVAYGTLSATMEWALERFIGGTGQTLETLTKNTAKNVGTKITKSLGKTAASKTTAKMIAAQLISSSVGEGIEEFVGNIGDVGLQKITGVNKDASINWGQAFYDLSVGMASGAIMGGVSTGVQTAYAEKNGAQINSDEARRERMLKQSRKMIETTNLTEGSDAVAIRLQAIRDNLQAYDNAKDKKSASANIALGNINNNLISAELNVLTDRSAAYIRDNASQEIADYATAFFETEVTVDMLKDINNQYTRALAMMDWAGGIVGNIIGKDAKVNDEIASVIEQEQAEAKAKAQKESDEREAVLQADAYKKAGERAVELTADTEWNGEDASFRAKAKDGKDMYATFTKQKDGKYDIRLIEEGVTRDFPDTTLEKAKATFNTLHAEAQKQVADAEAEANADEETLQTKKSLSPEETTEKRKKITRGMSEQERYEILKDRTITLTAKADMQKLADVEEMFDAKESDILSMKLKEKKALFKKIGEEFNLFHKYANEDVQLEFDYTKGGMDESTQKQFKNHLDYLKMLSCFDQVIENAVGIEVHNRNKEGYKTDPTLKDVYVLVSAFESGEHIIPVKLEIKEFVDKENKLYVAITLEGIKKEEIVTQGDTAQSGVTQDAPSSIISIAQLFRKINPNEERFLKYVPRQFFEDESLTTKKSLSPEEKKNLNNALKKRAAQEKAKENKLEPKKAENENAPDTEAESAADREGEKKAAETNISSSERLTDTKDEKTPETEEKGGETAKDEAKPESKEEEKAEKPQKTAQEGETESGVIGTAEEIKKAKKLVPEFSYLDVPTRNAIIEMLRTGNGIEKATLSSIGHIMAIRPGLHVVFAEGIGGEGSHTKLKSGDRLVLLDAELRHGKKYRADVIFHELYHDMVATGEMKKITETVVSSTSGAFRRRIADRYTKYYNGISITEWVAKKGEKWTEKNFDEYFKTYKGISRADVMEEIAAACMGKIMGTKGFIEQYGSNVKFVRRAFYGLRNLARYIANRTIQVGDESDGIMLAYRDISDYKRLYEVALLSNSLSLNASQVEKLTEKLVARDEAEEEAIPDFRQRQKEMEGEEQLMSKKAEETRYSLSVDDKKIAEINMTASEREAGEEIADFIEEVNGMKDKSKTSKRKKRIGPLSDRHRNLIEQVMHDLNPNFSAEGYELWIDGTAAVHIEERHGDSGEKDHTMAGRAAKQIIPWAAQNANSGEVLYKKGKIKLSERYYNKDGTYAPEIRVLTKLDDETIYVSECVPDASAKRIWITSAYLDTKKGSRGQLLSMEEISSPQPTPEAIDDYATKDMVPQPSEKVNTKTTKKSLPAEDATERAAIPTIEALEKEVNALGPVEPVNIKNSVPRDTVWKYLNEKYPHIHVTYEVSEDKTQVTITSITDRNTGSVTTRQQQEINADVLAYLESLGMTVVDAKAHASVLTHGLTAEEAAEVEKIVADAKADAEFKPERLKAYTKKEAAKSIAEAIANVLLPAVGGDVVLKGKTRVEMINLLFSYLNSTKPENQAQVAKRFAEELLLKAVYSDSDVNYEYEQMLIDGTREDFNLVSSYRGKLRGDTVYGDLVSRYGEKKAKVILRRWIGKDGGISINDAVIELQNEGILSDLKPTNDADMLIALNEEYEHLKERSEMRPELLSFATMEPDEYNALLDKMTGEILSLFKEGGKDTEYGRLVRRYRELLGEMDIKHQKDLEEAKTEAEKRRRKEIKEKEAKHSWELKDLERRLQKNFDRRVANVEKMADQSRAYWKDRAEEARVGRDEARVLNRIFQAARGLRDFVNREYAPATEMRDNMQTSVARLLLRAASRSKLKPQFAIDAAKELKAWADAAKAEDANFIGDRYAHSTITESQYEAISRLASLEYKDGMKLTLENLQDLEVAINVTRSVYNRRDQIFRDGKWQGIKEFAEKAVADAGAAIKDDEGVLAKIRNFIQKGMIQFMDPLSVAAHMDGYRYDGVMQTLMEEIAYAEAEANAMKIELRKPFEEWLDKHKKYAKRLAEHKIKLKNGMEIPLGHAITLTEMYKREQAKRGLELSRIGFHLDGGKTAEIEGYGRPTTVQLPSGETIGIKEADEVIRRWNNDRAVAVKNLKEFGYDVEQNAERAMEEFRKAVAGAESKAQEFIDKFGVDRAELIGDIEKNFSAEDKEFIALVSDFFQKTSKQVKTDADMQNLGYTNVIDGYYFPIKRMQADMAKSISDGSFFAEFVTAQNLSFNQKTLEGAKASIEIFNVWDVVTDHISGLAIWSKLYMPIQNLNKVWNYNIGETTTNVISLKNTMKKRQETDFNRYLSDLMLDVQGSRQKETKTAFDKGVNALRSTYAVYQLGLNPQTIVKQTLSWAAAAQILSPKNIALGIAHLRSANPDKMVQYSAVAAERLDDQTVVKAYSNTEKISKAAGVTMKGISWMDKVVNQGIWAAAQYEIAERYPDAPVGSEKNMELAGKLTNDVILYVQDSSDASTKSQAARSSSELLKGVTMFQSSALKMFSRVVESVGFLSTYRSLSKDGKGKYQKEYARAKRQVARTTGAAAAVAVLTALIVQLFKFLYNKDREDKDGNEISFGEDFAKDVGGEMLGFIPVIGDVAGYFIDGYDVSNFYYDTYNDLLKVTSESFNIAEKVVKGEVIEEWEVDDMLRDTARAAGYLTGIPVRNATNFLTGIVRRISPKAGYTYDTLFYNANYTEDVNKALKEGDEEMAAHILSLAIKRDKGGSTYSAEDLDTIVSLHNAGYSVMPRDINTDEVTKRKTYRAFETVYSQADSAVAALLKRTEFKAMDGYNTEEGSPQATAIKTLYTGYYELAEHQVLGKELTRKAALVSLTDPEELVLVAAYNKAITMGEVEISGTKKEAITAYMKALGMDKTAQAYAAWSLGYRNEELQALIEKDLKGKEEEDAYLIALGLKEAEETEEAA